jgi:hypothetical protein
MNYYCKWPRENEKSDDHTPNVIGCFEKVTGCFGHVVSVWTVIQQTQEMTCMMKNSTHSIPIPTPESCFKK